MPMGLVPKQAVSPTDIRLFLTEISTSKQWSLSLRAAQRQVYRK